MFEAASQPLRLERLFVRGFRNLGRVDLEPGPHFNVVSGENGAGKSNLLESIGYIGSLRSFRGARSEDLVGLGAEEALIRARVSGPDPSQPGTARIFAAQLGRGRSRRLWIDEKRPSSIARWLAALQVVVFHPGDLLLTMGSAEARRAFLDRALEQIEPTYRVNATAYQKALRSRNRLLREPNVDRRAIGAFEVVLATQGAQMIRARAAFVLELAPSVERAFEEVAGEGFPLSVRYAPRIPPDEEAIRRALRDAYELDRARGFTTEGPHADELELMIRSSSARRHASQGQHRALVLALKVAELEVLSRRVGRAPILLLDDVSSELDRARNRRFFALLSRMGGQVFLTTTHPELIHIEGERRDFQVEEGALRLRTESA